MQQTMDTHWTTPGGSFRHKATSLTPGGYEENHAHAPMKPSEKKMYLCYE